uniref:Transposon Ty3-I Gag-Pol polyprotein n=1 Tax=Cajanus cajan TaxID=3821 RepID=A0A151R610_CAJCA|nr:Transposon Ty3-I Gag-Pol polyprotein [Cajanus cajan]
MPGISADLICHKLAIHKEAKPVAQRKRKVGGERREAIVAETQKLLNAGFIREVRYTTWLANVVLVKKNSGKWRMCVDYTDLNKACPKDSYPLPSIDRLVDGASGHALLSFLDAYSGYNQIMMYPPDEVHTSFITDHANYCYRVMPFGLKNAGATYQRLMDKVFHQQIGRNMEVYVDDMVVKTTSAVDHAIDLVEVFAQVRKHNMRLNPEKCVFGVQGGKFLGFMITSRGIEANPEKCKAIIQMQNPQTVKEVQRLAGRLVSLLTYGTDAMIPIEVGQISHRRQTFNGEQNAQELAADLDLVDEPRDEAQIHEEVCKLRASQRYNTRVKPRAFRAGDLVWRLLGEARKDTSDGKLAPTWGGPFRVTEDLKNGAYRLEELNGKPIPRT